MSDINMVELILLVEKNIEKKEAEIAEKDNQLTRQDSMIYNLRSEIKSYEQFETIMTESYVKQKAEIKELKERDSIRLNTINNYNRTIRDKQAEIKKLREANKYNIAFDVWIEYMEAEGSSEIIFPAWLEKTLKEDT